MSAIIRFLAMLLQIHQFIGAEHIVDALDLVTLNPKIHNAKEGVLLPEK